jgi:hypothetical protein
MIVEKRAFARVSILAPLFVRPMSGATEDNCFSRLNEQGFDDYLKRSLYKKMNLSGSGLLFESDVPFAPGGILEVQLMLDDVYHGVFDICIEVLRVDMRPRGYRIAGKYVGIDESVRSLILQFITARENRGSSKKNPGKVS